MTTLRFTPGTEFMSKAKDALCLFAARYTSSNPNIKVIISGADREGEGEYKLFEYLRNLPLHEGDAFDATKRSRALVMGKYVTYQSLLLLLNSVNQPSCLICLTQIIRLMA